MALYQIAALLEMESSGAVKQWSTTLCKGFGSESLDCDNQVKLCGDSGRQNGLKLSNLKCSQHSEATPYFFEKQAGISISHTESGS